MCTLQRQMFAVWNSLRMLPLWNWYVPCIYPNARWELLWALCTLLDEWRLSSALWTALNLLTIILLLLKKIFFKSHLWFLPWETRVAFPGESQLRYPTYSICWAFWCFHNPPNSDVDYSVFNTRMWSCCMHTPTRRPRFIASSEGVLLSIESAQNFDPGEIRGTPFITSKVKVKFAKKISRKKIKLNELERKKLERQNTWQ